MVEGKYVVMKVSKTRIFMAIAAMSCTSGLGKSMISYIYESPFLKFIYENNLILKLIMLFV